MTFLGNGDEVPDNNGKPETKTVLIETSNPICPTNAGSRCEYNGQDDMEGVIYSDQDPNKKNTGPSSSNSSTVETKPSGSYLRSTRTRGIRKR